MESKVDFYCSSLEESFSTKTFSSSAERSTKVSDHENFVYSSGRSIAHMLPPIKPTINEDADVRSIAKPMEIAHLTDPGEESCLLSTICSRLPDCWEALDLSQNTSDDAVLTTLKPVVMPTPEPANLSVPDLSCNNTSICDVIGDEAFHDTTLELKEVRNPEVSKQTTQIPTKYCVTNFSKRSSDKEKEKNSNDSRVSIQEFLGTYKELDTHQLARKVKDVLVENNIGQRIFGQTVLGLTQGSVSDLLSHPKSWQLLSLKGREPFIRMQLWIDDPKNIEILRNFKSEKISENGNGINKSSSSPSEHRRCKNPSSKKKSRVVLSTKDKLTLLQAYDVEPYPCQSTVHELAKKLNKQPSTIINWFHNYRSRVKRGFFSYDEPKSANQDSGGKKRKREMSSMKQAEKIHMATFCKNATDNAVTSTSDTATSFNFNERLNPIQKVTPTSEDETNEENNPMFITATVLLSSSSQTVTPMWSFQIGSNNSVLPPNGKIKNLFLDVRSQRSFSSTTTTSTAKDTKRNCTETDLSKANTFICKSFKDNGS